MPREVLRDNLPKAFIKTGNNKCQVILDCAEVFIDDQKKVQKKKKKLQIYEFTLREQLIG